MLRGETLFTTIHMVKREKILLDEAAIVHKEMRVTVTGLGEEEREGGVKRLDKLISTLHMVKRKKTDKHLNETTFVQKGWRENEIDKEAEPMVKKEREGSGKQRNSDNYYSCGEKGENTQTDE